MDEPGRDEIGRDAASKEGRRWARYSPAAWFRRAPAEWARLQSRSPLAVFALALAWAMLVLVGYYAVHKPVAYESALHLASATGRALSAVALAGLAGGLGRRLLRAEDLPPLERFAVQFALGWGVLGLAWLAAGLLGWYSTAFAWGALALGWALLWRENLAWMETAGELAMLWRSAGRAERALGLAAALLVAGQLLLALAPPARWDALAYHLELPRRFLTAGRFEFTDWNPFWGQSWLATMAYTWATALSGPAGAAVLGWTFQAVLLAGVAGSAARRCGLSGGWVAVFALLAGFSFRWLMSAGYADGLAALYGYAALACALAWQERSQESWLAQAGLFAGFAALSKLTAAVLLPALVLGVFLVGSGSASKKASQALKALALAGMVLAPWLLLNAARTGNPLYPLLWPTAWVSQDRLAFFRGFEPAALGRLLWLPLAVTWFGVDTNTVAGMPAYAADLGPWLLLLAGAGLIGAVAEPARRLPATWLAAGWAAMAVGGGYSPLLWQTRLYFALLPTAALLAGWGWRALSGLRFGGARLGRALFALLALGLALSLWQDALALARLNPLSAVLGGRSNREYLAGWLGWYPAAMEDLGALPAGSKVLFLWDPRGLYAPLDSRPDVWIDRWYLDRRQYGEAGAIRRSWASQGFTHLLVNRAGAAFERLRREELLPGDWAALESLLEGLPSIARYGEDYELYALPP